MREAQKILIVEDDSISHLVLQKMLGKEFDIISAKNSDEAFEVLKSHQVNFILMDINLGEDSMNGTEIMQQVKSSQDFGNPVIFAITSYAMPEDKEAFLQKGFDNYLAKPIKKDDLLEAIDSNIV